MPRVDVSSQGKGTKETGKTMGARGTNPVSGAASSAVVDDCAGIPFKKFLEVMTNPGLHVKKQSRGWSGNSSSVRVLRYSEEKGGCLYWGSTNLMRPVVIKAFVADIQSVERTANTVVAKLRAGRSKGNSHAFECMKEQTAKTLHAGLEKLIRRFKRQS
ncbi:unnamed protein product [Discosporangium mesarthrocarpum]